MSKTFDKMYSHTGRPSIPPERLLKSMILMALYSVRSDRLFRETLDYNILFRWFPDMSLDERSFDHSVFSKNRDRLLEHEATRRFFDGVVDAARGADLLSDEHFTVDGTLIDAWASLKSFRPKDEDAPPSDDDPSNPSVDFRGGKRSNKTHASRTDPDSRLMRKGKGKEEIFGWMKTVGGLRKTRFRGLAGFGEQGLMTAAAYNLMFKRGVAEWQTPERSGETGRYNENSKKTGRKTGFSTT